MVLGRERRIGDLEHRLVIPTVNLTDSRPYIFQGGDLPAAGDDAAARVVDVAMAAAAAPTFFPAVEIAGELFIDGGLYAAMPDLLALETAGHGLGVARTDLRLLSVGTTSSRFSFARRERRDLGVLHWTREERFVRTILASQQGWTDRILANALGRRCLRIDHAQSRDQQAHLSLHVAPPGARTILRDLADESGRDAGQDERLQAMLSHEARPDG